ncbi:hypothetical protein BDZ90DRAFT_281613 [Jaminaea rosea]|uniref:Uncharacterized protein n=1 Tax=Jaminaea rosea TaxID=1569628 RepID=A0A316UJF8_9BASI|nr:hypothetical protein BDZ90DRAFT_281613 [Jaminaea rosea]PWN25406.1 hypothetical protein BDZ90DRAFT_281613 [Jaminaea rosea]
MNKTKRSEATEGENSKSQKKTKRDAPSSLSLAGFADLPHELQVTIINYACETPSSDDMFYRATCNEPLLDIQTTLSLSLVSRELHPHVTVLLYRRIRIVRPTTLALLAATLTSRPALGRVIRSLHVGPDDELPEEWHPIEEISFEDPDSWGSWEGDSPPPPETRFSHSLVDHETSKQPKDCSWSYTLDTARGSCQDQAVHSILGVAQEVIDVNLMREGYAMSGELLHPDEWTLRIFEAQAVLDLYLLELRRLQDLGQPTSSTKTGKGVECGHYPRLILNGYDDASTSRSKITRRTFVLHRSQLLRHLSRHKSYTDRFDHPLLFARSSCGMFVLAGPGRAGEDSDSLGQYDPYELRDIDFSLLEEDAEDYADQFSPDRLPATTPALDDGLDPALNSTATLGSLLSLTRFVLVATPRLRNLSLTGFLERAVTGLRTGAELKDLRSLSIGPPPPFWHAPMTLDRGCLLTVENLRICGVMLLEEEVDAIENGLPLLRRMQWSMAGKFDQKHSISLTDTINRLLNRRSKEVQDSANPDRAVVGSESAEEQHTGSSSSAVVDSSSSPMSSMSRDDDALPLIEIRLHRRDLESVLNTAPTSDMRTAWTEGRPLSDASRRLKLVRGKAAGKGTSFRGLGFTTGAWKALYEEGREWWEDEAKPTMRPKKQRRRAEGQHDDDTRSGRASKLARRESENLRGSLAIFPEWTTRVFEAQAGLDLYLMEIGRLESMADAKPTLKKCNAVECLHYPPLRLDGVAQNPKPYLYDEDQAFVIRYSQLLQHLARPGALTDRFDHPYLWSRSGVEMFVLDGPSRAGGDVADQDDGFDPHDIRDFPFDIVEYESEDFADLFTLQGVDGRGPDALRADFDLALDPAIGRTQTLGSILNLARIVLCCTARLQNLSLTGFLERALCGERFCTELKDLRSLSLGPPPPYWYAPMTLAGPVISRVENLRICGVMLREKEAKSIAGDFPFLTKMEWSMAGRFDEKHSISLSDTIDCLLKRRKSEAMTAIGADSVSKAAQQENQAVSSAESADSACEGSRPSALIEVKLHPDDVEELLRQAPDPDVRTAWLEGQPLADAPRRLRLIKGAAAQQRTYGRGWGWTSEAWCALYEEGKDWWEEEARLTKWVT